MLSLDVNGVQTALGCMTGAPDISCSDTANAVAIPASSLLSLRVTSSALNPFTIPAMDAYVTFRALASRPAIPSVLSR